MKKFFVSHAPIIVGGLIVGIVAGVVIFAWAFSST